MGTVVRLPIKSPKVLTTTPHGADVSLPDSRILQHTDANSFASLVLLNSKWRTVSQQAHLYAYQLSQCPSYAASHQGKVPPTSDDSLPKLRRLFAQEVKRNLFAAYLRPNRTIIKLVSNSISSSSCPGGEGMQFSSSPAATTCWRIIRRGSTSSTFGART